jgi:exonuclease SbcD
VITPYNQVDRDEAGSLESVGIVATSDNHLSAYLPRLNPARRAARRSRLRAGFDAAVTYAIERGARVFIQAGDLFDTPTPNNQDRTFAAQALARLRRAGIITIGIGGNHDTPRMATDQGGEAPQRAFAALEGLSFFPLHDSLQPQLFDVGSMRLAVAGLSNYPGDTSNLDPLLQTRLDDSENVLSQADVALLVLHAGIEGLCRPGEGEWLVSRAAIAALPEVFRLIVAGHAHCFAHERLGRREAVVCGSTERMEFGGPEGGSGFAWIELTRQGLPRVEHIPVPEQPRADLTISTKEIWPPTTLGVDALELPEADALPKELPARLPSPDRYDEPPDLREMIRERLAKTVTPETMVRLRLVGPLSTGQYHQLMIRDLVAYGQQKAFSFDLDTSGLSLLGEFSASLTGPGSTGPISPLREVESLREERLAAIEKADTVRVEDEQAAARLLIDRLRAARDWEAGR